MVTFTFLLQLYLSAVLGISGLAKVIEHRQFAATLRHQRLLPTWSIPITSRTLPWLEIGLSAFLVTGLLPMVTGGITLALFLCFLGVEVTLLTTKRSRQCGCYGLAYPRPIDASSLIVSVFFVIFAALNLWGVAWGKSVAISWRMLAIAVYSAYGIWLTGKIARRVSNLRLQSQSTNQK